MKRVLIGFSDTGHAVAVFEKGADKAAPEAIILSPEEAAEIRRALDHARLDAGMDPL